MAISISSSMTKINFKLSVSIGIYIINQNILNLYDLYVS